MTRRWDTNNYDDFYDGYEEVYQNSLTMVQIIEENRQLKRENNRLHIELEEYRENLNKQYQKTISQTANILGSLLK